MCVSHRRRMTVATFRTEAAITISNHATRARQVQTGPALLMSKLNRARCETLLKMLAENAFSVIH